MVVMVCSHYLSTPPHHRPLTGEGGLGGPVVLEAGGGGGGGDGGDDDDE